MDRYFVVERPHSARCYAPHCSESRVVVFDRLSGREVSAFRSLTTDEFRSGATEIAERLSHDWVIFREEHKIAAGQI